MMISPETFKSMYENRSLEECYEIRREIMNELIEYEDNKETRISYLLPSHETVYSVNNLYLIEICRLIEEKKEESEE